MCKKIILLLLCVCLTLGMAVPAHADEVTEEAASRTLSISTAAEFLEFAESCRLDAYSQELAVTLEADIDLTGHVFQGVPIFSGVFDGKGHQITSLNMQKDGSMQGLFRYLTNTAVVRDLTVSGTIQPGGSKNELGAIAGRNEGQILGCVFSGTLSGNDSIGGIAGTNAVTGIIENCRTEGQIHGSHFVGGIAGENSGVIRGCENKALINTTAQQNSVELSGITLDSLTNTEDVSTVTDIGGIAGISSGVIRGCENRADVGYRHMGYNLGGIAGTQTGYIAECKNYGNIQGRKEVGGIVGQMEPVSLVEYTEDTLQILQGQLNTMTGLVNQASGNAQANAGAITTQLGKLQDQTETARDAVESLFPDEEEPTLPDADSILAAQNTLTATMDAMPGTLKRIASATQATLYNLNRDLNAISGQISAMGQTLNNASENLGGTVTDISDQDTPEDLTAKVEACVNYADVLADLNAGGIAGAMATENDSDIWEDWQASGDSSLNFHAQVRAVILNCQNSGTVTGTKQNVGGITGWQSLGLVKDSGNTGTVDGTNANYVGGISGLSTGYLRADSAQCEILGGSYVGGIAGSATVVTDSLALVRLTGATEKQGGILGYAEDPQADVEDPIRGNYYLQPEEDYGAVDGISYAGLAESMAFDDFMALEALPELFKTVTVRFVFDDGTETLTELASGGRLNPGSIPQIPEKAGYMSQWEGLADADLSNILFDLTFEARYTAYHATIQSRETDTSGRPVLLVEGSFTDEATASVTDSEAAPTLGEKERLLDAWEITLSEAGTNARLLLPEGADAEALKLLLCEESGAWSEVSFTQNGSYLVFALSQTQAQVALVQSAPNHMGAYAAAGCALLALIVLIVILAKRSRKNRNAAAA